ncbi:hypothetical protein JTE90_026592 [Oedothorax gibbosus]|uniref:Uncharacterized protein n=1 Tax=Oedothorax gibbosus TaxID=931172 RepID=A0AAV6TPB5_9ARAC|nr:hypothetical protein JTE90_026592 [Oedothorax gibbosus]
MLKDSNRQIFDKKKPLRRLHFSAHMTSQAQLFTLLLTLSVGLSFGQLCPPPEDILPCYCVSDGHNSRVE